MDLEPKKVGVQDFHNLILRARAELGIQDEEVVHLPIVKQIRWEGKRFYSRNVLLLCAGLLFLVVIGLPTSLYLSIRDETKFGNITVQTYMSYLDNENPNEGYCLFKMPSLIYPFTRPPVNCSECANVEGIQYAYNLTQEKFISEYAFGMQPVLVKDGQQNWTAHDMFSYHYFKSVYSPGSEALEKSEKECQFFPYETEMRTLGEFFNMSDERVAGNDEPYYCGWSNCDGKAANELRKHYKLPYFLPPELDHSKTDWVFMGLSGFGAYMHIDNVGTTSWQAQIKGTKKWVLEAPPECHGTCISRMEVIVEPGDIIVLDTNKWFHSTEIMGKETSIVIGSEYY
uniref:Cupin-like domain-containing protein n=1 Tax=Ciona savignyi TaxID=51511 RepID=H2YDJ8_CIOSA